MNEKIQPFPDPDDFLNEHIRTTTEKYAAWSRDTGIEMTPKLAQAIAQREVKRARDTYITTTEHIYQQNVQAIQQDTQERIQEIQRRYHQRNREIKRDGARLAWYTCPLAILLFSVIAWYNFAHNKPFNGVIFAVAAAAFLTMLLLAQARKL